ncbi:MAG: hypothetical protein U1E02_18665, partial [Hydrogenophaga sp.]|nr:hypothetical protein [Hydrogenophaga sp.]
LLTFPLIINRRQALRTYVPKAMHYLTRLLATLSQQARLKYLGPRNSPIYLLRFSKHPQRMLISLLRTARHSTQRL